MPDCLADTGLTLTSAGRPGLDALTAGHQGSVAALFDHSFYVDFGGSWVCVGTETMPMGPLNVRTSAPAGFAWRSCGFQIGNPANVDQSRLSVGHSLEIGIADVSIWLAPPLPAWTIETTVRGLDELDRLIGSRVFAGLGGFALADHRELPDDPVVSAARQSVEGLSRAARCAFSNLPFSTSESADAVVALLGLGPGLTPSGDDLLGGMLIALNILPAPTLRAHLNREVESHGAQRTNALSLAHLRAAGEGSGHEALHRTFNNLLSGDRAALPPSLSAIDKVGHSSGWDAMAGLCIVLRAYLTARQVP